MPDISLGLTNLFSSDYVEFNIVSELNIWIDIVYLLHFLHWFLHTLIWLHMTMRTGYMPWSYDNGPWLHSMVWLHMTMRPGFMSWSYDDCPWLRKSDLTPYHHEDRLHVLVLWWWPMAKLYDLTAYDHEAWLQARVVKRIGRLINYRIHNHLVSFCWKMLFHKYLLLSVCNAIQLMPSQVRINNIPWKRNFSPN